LIFLSFYPSLLHSNAHKIILCDTDCDLAYFRPRALVAVPSAHNARSSLCWNAPAAPLLPPMEHHRALAKMLRYGASRVSANQ
jgi:hypothetical protein